MPNYVECAGVRVPQNWTIEQLLDALGKRKVKFTNEADIKAAFQIFLETRDSLQAQIDQLERRRDKLI